MPIELTIQHKGFLRYLVTDPITALIRLSRFQLCAVSLQKKYGWIVLETMIQKRLFGRTGHESSITLFGAAALGGCDQATADKTLDLLLQYGVNHIDTAPSYGDSELRVGPWMKQHRNDFFLATKIDQRTYREAKEQIHQSLDRLQTDHIDLLQFHALVHPDEWDTVMREGGALEAVVEAREAGLVKHIGVTGHNWTIAAMHKRSLERFR